MLGCDKFGGLIVGLFSFMLYFLDTWIGGYVLAHDLVISWFMDSQFLTIVQYFYQSGTSGWELYVWLHT